jgi:hypothetical protein
MTPASRQPVALIDRRPCVLRAPCTRQLPCRFLRTATDRASDVSRCVCCTARQGVMPGSSWRMKRGVNPTRKGTTSRLRDTVDLMNATLWCRLGIRRMKDCRIRGGEWVSALAASPPMMEDVAEAHTKSDRGSVALPPSDKRTVCAQYEHLTSEGSYAGDLSAIPLQIPCIVRHSLVVEKIVVLARQQDFYKGRTITHRQRRKSPSACSHVSRPRRSRQTQGLI